MRCATRSFESHQMMLLAPSTFSHHPHFNNYHINPSQYWRLLGEAQALRGRVYLRDGAVRRRQLSRDGRLIHFHDEQSWQLLVKNAEGRVSGCARCSPQKDHVPFSDLGIAGSALANSPSWSSHVRVAVEAKRAEARHRGFNYVELGGWVFDEQSRHSSEILRLSLHVGGLMKLLGGALAVTTATIRHRSSTILRKLGGYALHSDGVELPSYYDPQYECEMEILGFDSDRPNPKYSHMIQECQRRMGRIPVVLPGTHSEGGKPGKHILQNQSMN